MIVSIMKFRPCANSFVIQKWVMNLNRSVHSYIQQPIEGHLLSLLEKHQSLDQLSQVHCQFIRSGSYCNHCTEIAASIWSKLMREYSQGSIPERTFKLFKEMQEAYSSVVLPDSYTIAFLLKACANLMDPMRGTQIHGHVVKVGLEYHIYVGTALLNMYLMCRLVSNAGKIFDNMYQKNQVTWNVMVTGLTKYGELDLAVSIFKKMPHQNIVSWTGIIDGFTRANRPKEALILFNQMMRHSIKPTAITILTIIPAVFNLGNLNIGQSIHAYTKKVSFNMSDIRVSNALMDMYAKCGSIENVLRIFESSMEKNVVSWTTMISALATHGMAREAVSQFKEMRKVNLKPNQVTFLCVLSACSHGGLVEEGLELFQEMVQEFRVVPEIKHYGCVVDMLGRCGRLEEAEQLIMDMPMKDNVILWRTLLGACSFYGNPVIGERVMKRILEMEKRYGGDYVLLSNMFVGSGRFDAAERVRTCMDEEKAGKVPGLSLIDNVSANW